MARKNFSTGFSLIELLVAVTIVGIIAAVAVPAYFNYILRTKQADAYHNLLDIKAAQEMYYSMYNEYAGDNSLKKLASIADTYTKMLSFNIADTKYYIYLISAFTGPDSFEAKAMGKRSKLTGNSIKIQDDSDPCMEDPGSLKQSLGLPDC